VLRNQVIDMLEQAEIEPPEEQAGLLTFVVAGAGFAGVELVADLNDFVHEAAEHYRHVDPERIKVFLVDPGQRILPELSEDLGEFALAKLRARGIEVRLGTRIEDASETDVTLSDGHTIRTRSFIWTAGVAPSPILGTLPCAHDQRGRILTNEFMEVPDYENVWAIGDCAAIPDLRTGKTYPPTAQHAIRQGRLAAKNIAASIMGGQMRAFIYDMKGQLASLGRRSGVANLLWDQVFRLLCLVALAHDLPFQIAAARAQGSGGPGLDARSHLFQRHREIKDLLTRACPTGD